ncbi:hypothetical protein AgCh_021847 [Apium graveolens]
MIVFGSLTEINGGEEKKEEPLVDVSAPADEAPKAEEVKTAEPETTSEVMTEEKPKEEAAVEKVVEPVKETAAEEVAQKSDINTESISSPNLSIVVLNKWIWRGSRSGGSDIEARALVALVDEAIVVDELPFVFF